MRKTIAILSTLAMVCMLFAGCGNTAAAETKAPETTHAAATEAPVQAEPAPAEEDPAAAVAAMIDAIYVQTRTDETDAQCAAAKAAWDALTDEQKELVEGLRSLLGLAAKVTLVAPKSIVRSEGKAVRVIDKRKI